MEPRAMSSSDCSATGLPLLSLTSITQIPDGTIGNDSTQDFTAKFTGTALTAGEKPHHRNWHLGSHWSGIPGARSTTCVSKPPVPEPSTYAMFLAGLTVLGFCARRKALVG